jgi:hypothetical protein
MDFSPEYILMCEKAVFLQHAWTIAYGDFYCDKSAVFATRDGSTDGGISLVDDKVLIDVLNQDFKRTKAVWLPRQDQFHEMLNISYPAEVVIMLRDFISSVTSDTIGRWRTMEQLWLSAYALRKHNRAWTGTEWIAAEEPAAGDM